MKSEEIKTNLKGDRSERCAHASVESTRALGGYHSPENGHGGATPRVLLHDPQAIKWVSRHHARHATQPSCHKLPPPTACKKLWPEIHSSPTPIPQPHFPILPFLSYSTT